MPRANEAISPYQRLILYGAAKTKKTWWAMNAAEAGYNVLVADSDRGSGIVQALSERAKERIYILETADSAHAPVAFNFMHSFAQTLSIYWNEESQQVSHWPQAGFMEIDLRLPNPNLVFVLDSWSALCRSIDFEFARKNNINLADADKIEWDGYGWAGRVAFWILAQLKSLPCHLIIIGHEHAWDRYTGQKQSRKIVESRIQPYSVSGPHGKQLGREFNDIMRFYRQGITNWIDLDGNINKDAGSRFRAPGLYDWNEFQFATIAGVAQDDTIMQWGEGMPSAVATAAPVALTSPPGAPSIPVPSTAPRIQIPRS